MVLGLAASAPACPSAERPGEGNSQIAASSSNANEFFNNLISTFVYSTIKSQFDHLDVADIGVAADFVQHRVRRDAIQVQDR